MRVSICLIRPWSRSWLAVTGGISRIWWRRTVRTDSHVIRLWRRRRVMTILTRWIGSMSMLLMRRRIRIHSMLAMMMVIWIIVSTHLMRMRPLSWPLAMTVMVRRSGRGWCT